MKRLIAVLGLAFGIAACTLAAPASASAEHGYRRYHHAESGYRGGYGHGHGHHHGHRGRLEYSHSVYPRYHHDYVWHGDHYDVYRHYGSQHHSFRPHYGGSHHYGGLSAPGISIRW